MELKGLLKMFNSLRLQKAAYFMDLFSSKKYFRFVPHKYGPYDHSIDIVSKGIREFQQFHGTSSTKEAEKILFNKLTSESVNNTLQALLPWIIKSCDFVIGLRKRQRGLLNKKLSRESKSYICLEL